MRKNITAIAILASVITLYACKGNKSQTDQTTTPVATSETSETTPATTTTPAATTTAAVKTYNVTVTPDTVTLGKNNEAFIRIKNLKAVELSNPDGQATGIQLSYDVEVTDRNVIGKSNVYLNPNNFRLVLDNATKLTHDTYNTVSVDPEATASSSGNIFKIPVGAKPVGLDLFFDETRASVKLEMK